MRVVEIVAEDIIPCMSGARIFDRGLVDEPEECEIRSGWAPICRAIIAPNGTHEVVAVACAHPRHGVCPEFKAVYEQLATHLPTDDECPLCEGGWLAPTSAEARQQILVGHAIGVYRGIRIPRHGERNEQQAKGKGEA